ncbi:Gfo/Idh/MocA family protein [Modestobacter lapidis]|nr:Gfo/Idh/MocA family oxidoreductase [Modestobacter lapidis]
MSRLRVGCVGTGFIAGRHLGALSGLDDVEIVAVADSLPGRAEEVAARYGARAYPDGAALLDTEELDAVWFCVPPFAHGPLETAALARRLPFFVEKPLALDLGTAREVARGVRETGVVTAVGYHWRHLDLVARAAELLRDAPPQLVTGHWLDRTPAAPWWSRRNGSGGQVLEQTTHLFDLARHLVGEVATVSSGEVTRPRQGFPSADAPTAATALLGFASGAVGTISSTSALGWRHAVGLQLLGAGLVVELGERSLTDHELRVSTVDGAQVTVSDEDPIAREDREFLAAVRGGTPVQVPYEEALRTHALAWAADLSAREGRPVRPDEELS